MSKILTANEAEALTGQKHELLDRQIESKSQGEADRLAKQICDIQRQLDADLNERRRTGFDEARARAASIVAGSAGVASDGTSAALRDAFDPRSKTTEYTADCPEHVMFRAGELYTGDSATTYSSHLFQNVLYGKVWEHLNAASAVLEAGPTIILTRDHLRPVDVPVLLTDATAGQTAELSAASQSYPVYDKVTLDAYRQDGYFLFSEEMRLASEFNLENLLADAAGRAIGTQVAALTASGAGTTTCAGVDTCTSSTTAASTTTVTADEIIATFMDLPRPYQRTASFIVASGLYQQMLQWKTGEGEYLLRTMEGAPDRFMGRPLYVEPQLADPASGTVPLVVGDFAQGFAVRLSPIHFEIDKSLYFREFVLVARYAVWMDSQIVDGQALRSLTMNT